METILIIDDSIVSIQMLTDILKSEYSILTAKTGEEGIALAMREAPSLILLDINMPGISGLDVIVELQKHEVTSLIPVIFLTGIDNPQVEEKAFFLGAVDYIKKPYYPNVVLARVRTHVSMYIYRMLIESQLSMDTLTGVYTRKHFEDYFARMWRECLLKERPITVSMIDIDKFKAINDTYGHQEGDVVLKLLAKTVKSVLPEKNSYIARVGGEEFIVILDTFKKEDARFAMEHVRELVAKMFSRTNQSYRNQVKDVTISIGGATILPEVGFKKSELINRADRMLYLSKESGRNRVTWYED